jgi:polysaccharide export outer membrane protein
MVLKWLVVTLTLLTGLMMIGPVDAQQAAVRQQPIGAPTPVAPDYVIGPEDVLLISVWKNETLSRQLPVRPDGKISMPLLHDIEAAGLTPLQLRDKIATGLTEYMPNPKREKIKIKIIKMKG